MRNAFYLDNRCEVVIKNKDLSHRCLKHQSKILLAHGFEPQQLQLLLFSKLAYLLSQFTKITEGLLVFFDKTYYIVYPEY